MVRCRRILPRLSRRHTLTSDPGSCASTAKLQSLQRSRITLLRPLEGGLEVAALQFAFLVVDGAPGTILVLLPGLLCQALRERHVPGLLHEAVEVLEVEVDERLDGLVLLEGLRA